MLDVHPGAPTPVRTCVCVCVLYVCVCVVCVCVWGGGGRGVTDSAKNAAISVSCIVDHKVLLLVVLHLQLLCVCVSEVRGLVCQSNHFLQIQKICRAQNEALLTAEKNHDDGMVCK